MATYQAPFQRDAISEVVPRALELSSLSKSSLLTGRRRIRVIPQTGQTYGASTGANLGTGKPTLANILLQDSAGLLDMQSVVLSMNVKVQTKTSSTTVNAIAKTAAGYVDVTVNPYAASLGASAGLIDASSNTALTAPLSASPVSSASQAFDVIDLKDDDPLVTAVLDDFAWSVFRRIQISLNSQLVDDLDYCGRRATTEVYQSASPSWYDTIGTIMGGWKLAQGEYVQPLIVAPVSGVLGGSTVVVGSFPIKSRVQAHQWAAYSHQLAVTNTNIAVNAVFPSINSAGVPTSNLPVTVPDNGNFWIVLPPSVNTNSYLGPWEVVIQCASPAADLSGVVSLTNVSPTGIASWAGEFAVTNGTGLLKVRAINAAFGVLTVDSLIFENSGTGAPVVVNQVVLTGPRGIAVMPTVSLGSGLGANAQQALNGQTWLDGAVGALSKLGHSWTQSGPFRGSPLAVRPICAAPDYTATVARTDVLSKLYSTSAFMKDVFFNRALPSTAPTGACANPPLLASGLLETVYLNNTANANWATRATPSDGPKFSIPMGLLSHLFRQEQLFPLRNAGQLIIQIQFADALECCYAGFLYPRAHQALGNAVQDLPTFSRPGTISVGYEVSNLEMECDIVTAIPEYTAILDAICSRPADKGLAIAFDSHLSSLQQVSTQNVPKYGQASGNGSSQTFTLIASKGSENVRSFTWTFSPSAGLRSQFYMQNSTFPAYNINQWQIRVGSVYYPAFPSKGLSKNYMEMLSAINSPMPSIGQATLVNYNMYRASTPSYDFYTPQSVIDPANCQIITPDGGGMSVIESWRYDPKAGVFSQIRDATAPVANILLQDPATSYMADAYIGSYCFDNLKHAEPLSHDGIDTRAIAGGMIQLDFTCEPLENFAVVYHIRFTRTIVLAENGVSIVG
jgi:hypothetical protein